MGANAVAPGVVEASTLRAMFEPQFGGDVRRGIGLGFFLGDLEGHLRVGHGGAMYGFATELVALPEEGLAVAVITTKDFASAVPQRVADRALRWLRDLGGRCRRRTEPSQET